MAGEYRPVELKKFPAPAGTSASANTEARFWKKFRFPILLHQVGPVTSIDFSPIAPHEFAVSSSARVQLFNPNTNEPRKVLNRFEGVAYSARYRNDGKLLVAGGEEGVVRIFDMGSRAILRTLKGHEKPVRLTRFSPSNSHIMSGSDDCTVKCWDISSGETVTTFKGHTDQIRCGSVSPASTDIWASGSYDHTIKLWDLRTGQCMKTLDHGAPVEDMLIFPGGGILVSAGGRNIKIWDILGGFRELDTLSNHHKTVTSVFFDPTRSRLFTASLDHHVKIYDTNTYKVTHTIKFPSAILCVGISPNNTHLVTGMADGMLSIRHRVSTMEEQVAQQEQKRNYSLHSWKYLMRGRDEYAPPTAFKVERGRKKKLQDYDLYLRKFQYRKALDAGLETKDPLIIVSLLEEFMRRKTTSIPLSGRTDQSLKPILLFLIRYISNQKYMPTLIPICNILLGIYAPVLGQSKEIDALFKKLQHKVNQEIRFQKLLFGLQGVFDMIFAQNSNAFGGLASADVGTAAITSTEETPKKKPSSEQMDVE